VPRLVRRSATTGSVLATSGCTASSSREISGVRGWPSPPRDPGLDKLPQQKRHSIRAGTGQGEGEAACRTARSSGRTAASRLATAGTTAAALDPEAAKQKD
jgi:hypothetical protein